MIVDSSFYFYKFETQTICDVLYTLSLLCVQFLSREMFNLLLMHAFSLFSCQRIYSHPMSVCESLVEMKINII